MKNLKEITTEHLFYSEIYAGYPFTGKPSSVNNDPILIRNIEAILARLYTYTNEKHSCEIIKFKNHLHLKYSILITNLKSGIYFNVRHTLSAHKEVFNNMDLKVKRKICYYISDTDPTDEIELVLNNCIFLKDIFSILHQLDIINYDFEMLYSNVNY